MARKSRYTDAEWRSLFPVDAEGRSLVSDTSLAARCRVTRQTVLAARRRLGIRSHRDHVRATRGARSKSTSIPLSDRERQALDHAAASLRMSRSEFLGRVLQHPQVALLARPGAEVIIRIVYAASDAEDAM